MKVLLVTLAIGDRYLQIYNLLFRKSQEEYAKKHKYDFKIITNFISSNTTFPLEHRDLISFQKILVCSQPFSTGYDFIIFIDADILINKNTPPLHNIIDFGDKIGIVDEYSQPTPKMRIQLQKQNKWEDNATDYYKLAGLDIITDKVLNTGVLVMQPKKHAEFLVGIYNNYTKMAINHSRGFGFEQSCIGFELQNRNMFILLDNKWNALWALYRDTKWFSNLQEMYENNYMIHFAGKCDYQLVPYIRQ
jgi:hypothetical protein